MTVAERPTAPLHDCDVPASFHIEWRCPACGETWREPIGDPARHKHRWA